MAAASSYSPTDWYWKAQDGRLFSSAKASTVSPTDAGFVAWSANGRAPTAWPRDEAGVTTDAALQEVLALYGISVTSVRAVPQSVTRAQAKIALHPTDIDYERPPRWSTLRRQACFEPLCQIKAIAELYALIVTEDMLAPHREEGKPLRLTRESVAYLREPPHVPSRLFSDSANFLQSSWRSEQVDPHDPRNGLQVVPVLAFVQSVPRLKAKPEWMLLRHQAGGYGCEQICMIATRLELRPALKPALDAIAREGYGAEAGHFSSSDILASRIARYVNALAELGLDCESSWRLLTESVYPIDATQENLDRVANSAPQLSDIVDWDGSIRVRYSSDPAILLLTDNSD